MPDNAPHNKGVKNIVTDSTILFLILSLLCMHWNWLVAKF